MQTTDYIGNGIHIIYNDDKDEVTLCTGDSRSPDNVIVLNREVRETFLCWIVKNPRSITVEKAVSQNKQLRSALIGLVGKSEEKDLQGMVELTRTYMAQDIVSLEDGTAMINAVRAILETIK